MDCAGIISEWSGEKNNLLSNITSLSPAAGTGSFTLTQVGQPGLSSLYNPDKKDFAPRDQCCLGCDRKGKNGGSRRVRHVLRLRSRRTWCSGHLPYAPFFDPGPAYNNFGPQPILSTGADRGAIVPGSPVYAPTTTCGFECDVFAFDRNIKSPYMENYNLNIQQQISSKAVLQVGYVGSQGHRLWRFFDLGQPSEAQINAADQSPALASGLRQRLHGRGGVILTAHITSCRKTRPANRITTRFRPV